MERQSSFEARIDPSASIRVSVVRQTEPDRACLIVGSPFVGVSSAATGGGLHKPVSASFGDCKNDNSGKHNGYDCPTDSGSGTSPGGILVF